MHKTNRTPLELVNSIEEGLRETRKSLDSLQRLFEKAPQLTDKATSKLVRSEHNV